MVSTFFTRVTLQSCGLHGERISGIGSGSGGCGRATSVLQVVFHLFDDVFYVIDDSLLGSRSHGFFGDGQLFEHAVSVLEVRRQVVVEVAHFGRPVVFDGHLPLEATYGLLWRYQVQFNLLLRQFSQTTQLLDVHVLVLQIMRAGYAQSARPVQPAGHSGYRSPQFTSNLSHGGHSLRQRSHLAHSVLVLHEGVIFMLLLTDDQLAPQSRTNGSLGRWWSSWPSLVRRRCPQLKLLEVALVDVRNWTALFVHASTVFAKFEFLGQSESGGCWRGVGWPCSRQLGSSVRGGGSDILTGWRWLRH